MLLLDDIEKRNNGATATNRGCELSFLSEKQMLFFPYLFFIYFSNKKQKGIAEFKEYMTVCGKY